MKKRIYLIEDDPDICDVVRALMEGYGYTFAAFQTGRDARLAIRREPPDLVLVDLILPDMNGLELVRELWSDVRFGLIVLTGRAEVSDRVLGLELGADDYIVKPFEPRELVARVRSILRRYQRSAAPELAGEAHIARFAGWEFDGNRHTLTAPDGREIGLSAAEAGLLATLLRRPNKILSREQLLGERDVDPFDRSIDVRISRLRRKLDDDPHNPRLIKTVYGAGYLFSSQVEWI